MRVQIAALLSIAPVIAFPQASERPPLPVEVTNPGANPVPVAVVGATTPVPVSVAGATNPVPVTISGTLPVSVTGTAQVSVSQEPATRPLTAACDVLIQPGETWAGTSCTLETDGQLAVIRTVTAECNDPDVNQLGFFWSPPAPGRHQKAWFFPRSGSNSTLPTTSVYLPVAATSTVYFYAYRGALDGIASCTIYLVGSLE